MSSTYRYEAFASASVVPASAGHTGITPTQGLTVPVVMGFAVTPASQKTTRTDAPPGPLG